MPPRQDSATSVAARRRYPNMWFGSFTIFRGFRPPLWSKRLGGVIGSPEVVIAVDGGVIPFALAVFRCYSAVLCVALFVHLVANFIACLVVGSLYVLSLASGTTVSLRSPSRPSAACGRFASAAGPSGLPCTKNRVGMPPPQDGGD